jgi:hypothetical protein
MTVRALSPGRRRDRSQESEPAALRRVGWSGKKWQDKSFRPPNTRKDAKIQRAIAVNPNLFRVFGVFRGLKAWFSSIQQAGCVLAEKAWKAVFPSE